MLQLNKYSTLVKIRIYIMDKNEAEAKQIQQNSHFIGIWKCFPIISSYLTQPQRIQMHSTNSVVKSLTSNSSFWPKMELGGSVKIIQQIEWFSKYLRIFKPTTLIISLFDMNQSLIDLMVKMLTQGVIESVHNLDIYCQSEDIHLASSLSFPNLQQITIRSRCVTNQLLQFMAQNLPKLHSLVVIKNDMEFTCKNLSEYIPNPMEKLIVKPHMIQFSQVQLITQKSQNSLKQLQIDVEECDQRGIIKILQPLRRLQKLRLYHLQNLQDDCQLWQALTKQSRILELAITKTYNFPLNRIINAITSKYLITLDITDSKHVNDDDIIELVKGCPSLKQINVSWCNGITAKGLKVLTQSCLNLQVLHITGVKQSRDIIFGDEYNSLLKIFDNQKFTKVKNMGSINPQLKQSDQIYETNYFFHSNVNYSKIKSLRKLKLLDCQSCNGISDEILRIIYVINRRVRAYNYYGNYMGLFPNESESTF